MTSDPANDIAGNISAGKTVSGISIDRTAPTTFNYTATATDKAGNTSNVYGTYKVIYNVPIGTAFFLQPINDTAHTTGATTSIVKAGSTVPVKFQLKDATGKVIQTTTAPIWLTLVVGSKTSAPVDETVYSASGDSGSSYRWDSSTTPGQYIYNWKTGSTGGNYWRIGVMLDDEQTYYVNIGLR